MSGYEANYCGSGCWLHCRLVKEKTDGTLEVIYEDGERGCFDSADYLRPAKSKCANKTNDSAIESSLHIEPTTVGRVINFRPSTTDSLHATQKLEQTLSRNEHDSPYLKKVTHSLPLQSDTFRSFDQVNKGYSGPALPTVPLANRSNGTRTRRCSITKVIAPQMEHSQVDSQIVARKDTIVDDLKDEVKRLKTQNVELRTDLIELAEQLTLIVEEVVGLKKQHGLLVKQLCSKGVQILKLNK